MKIGSSRSGIDNLDRYLAKKNYDKAVDTIKKELKRNPDQLNLRLRYAEILDLQGKRDKAISMYRTIAEAQAHDGFYARAIAVYKKILRLDPEQDVHSELAKLIEDDRQTKIADQRRREHGTAIEQEKAAVDQELKELQSSTLFSSFEREALVEIVHRHRGGTRRKPVSDRRRHGQGIHAFRRRRQSPARGAGTWRFLR